MRSRCSTRRWRVAERAARLHGLGGVLIAVMLATMPHALNVRAWITLLLVATAAWRWVVSQRDWPLPPRWLRLVCTMLATLAILASYRTLNGLEAGTAFLVLMASVKLLETRTSRDLTILVFIAFFLLFASLLRDQGLPQLPLLLACVAFSIAALMRVYAAHDRQSNREVLKRTAAMMLQALPLAAALFLLFPRLPGPFWGIAAGQTGRTGLDDQMTPGDVSDLTASGEVAFRVRFAGPLPPPSQRYWRGPVLHEFDGRAWRRPRAQFFPDQPVRFSGAPTDYQITLEPHDRHWVLALDLPSQWPQRETLLLYDYTLVSRRPLSDVATFRLRSYPVYMAGTAGLPTSLQRRDLQLPAADNPRTVALGRELAARHRDPRDIVAAMLRMFREQEYVYTMRPPLLADNVVDEFLFDTRSGFCEHYASAFTVVMRAAGIPARVVTGYQGGELNPLGGYLVVRQSDAHAWSEVWIDNAGWVRVDPTGAVAPERIERGLINAVGADEPVPGRLRSESELWLQADLAWDVVNDFWNERIVRFDAGRQLAMLERLGLAPDWRTLGLGLTGALAVFFVALSAWLGWKFRRPPRDWPARLHEQTAQRLARRGLIPGRIEGPVHFLERARARCPDLSRELQEIESLYVALRYGPEPRADDLRRLKHAVNALRV
jgi:transglutaminase-like putative cysteine protease